MRRYYLMYPDDDEKDAALVGIIILIHLLFELKHGPAADSPCEKRGGVGVCGASCLRPRR